jgi:chromosome segregation ATPase
MRSTHVPCPYCRAHGGGVSSDRCSVGDEIGERQPERFATWKEQAEYNEARAIHLERELDEVTRELAKLKADRMRTAGSDALKELRELRQELATSAKRRCELGSKVGSLTNKLRGAEWRAENAKRVAMKEVLATILAIATNLQAQPAPPGNL